MGAGADVAEREDVSQVMPEQRGSVQLGMEALKKELRVQQVINV